MYIKSIQNIINDSINDNSIKLLTYNASYEAMCPKNTNNIKGEQICKKDECRNNLINFISNKIKSQGLDFICLQEVGSCKNNNMIIDVPKLIYNGIRRNHQNYKNILHDTKRSGGIMTIYNSNKYEVLYSVKSFMETGGRQFMIIVFKNKYNQEKFCMINCHAGHGGDIFNLDKYINETFKYETRRYNSTRGEIIKNVIFSSNVAKKEIIYALNNYPLILCGDMNNELTNKIYIRGKELFNKTLINTCCNNNLDTKNHNLKYDHILISDELLKIDIISKSGIKDSNKNIVYKNNKISDHLPVLAKIILKDKLNKLNNYEKRLDSLNIHI